MVDVELNKKDDDNDLRAEGLVEYRVLADIEAVSRVDGESREERELTAEIETAAEFDLAEDADESAVQVGALASP